MFKGALTGNPTQDTGNLFLQANNEYFKAKPCFKATPLDSDHILVSRV